MESIIIRCKACKHAMKFSAEKVGKRAKCPKCDAVVLIQADPVAEAPASTPAEPEEPDDYGVTLDPELAELARKRQEEEDAKGKAKKERKKLPKVARKVKVIPDAEAWQKVRIGMLFVHVGVWVWLVCHLLQGSYVLLGYVELSEYANMMARNFEERAEPPPENAPFPAFERGWDIDELGVYLEMITGAPSAVLPTDAW